MKAAVTPAMEANRRAGRDRLVVAEEYAAALAAAGVRVLDDLLHWNEGDRLDKSGLPGWRERLRLMLPGLGRCYLKRYVSPPFGRQVKRMLSGGCWASEAAAEWSQIRRLEAADIETLMVLAAGDRMSGPWERASVVLTAELPGQSIESYVADHRERARRGWTCSLAEFVRRFHRAGYVHRDLYACHIFVDWNGTEPSFRLIDLARMFAPGTRKRRWMVKDLAALNYSIPRGVATRSDRLRFLRVYLGVTKLGKSDKRLALQVARKTKRIAAHDAERNGRSGGAF